MSEPTEGIGTRMTLADCCHALGIDPPLRPRQRITWLAMNAAAGGGINAEIRCFDPTREDEPFVLSLGAYETLRVVGPAGQDYGTDHSVLAALDFALEAEAGITPSSWDDPANVHVTLAHAEWGLSFAGDDDRSLDALLVELGQMLQSWPAQQETLEPVDF
ncbi:MAG: hypothetical protein H6972_12500 [Gammaproteobacteria bacterium]|nr:hypothetical protein [Gammaproteobacteria bacterium]